MKSDRPIFSINYLKSIVELLESKGVSKEELLAGTGIEETMLKRPDYFVGQGQYMRFIRRARALYPEPALGFYIGRQFNIATHGLLGLAAISSQNVLKAVEIGIKYAKIHNRALDQRFFIKEGYAILEFEALIDLEELYPMVMEITIRTIFGSLEQFFGGLPPSCEIGFAYARPPYAEIYEREFKTEIHFDCPVNYIRIPAKEMERPLSLTNPEMTQQAERERKEALLGNAAKKTLSQRIHNILLLAPETFPSQEDLAQQLHMSSRTLRLQLSQCGTSFRKILEDVRQTLAVRYLGHSDRTIDEIAYLLDYTDRANFTRAFKRWMGCSPSDYRKSQNSHEG